MHVHLMTIPGVSGSWAGCAFFGLHNLSQQELQRGKNYTSSLGVSHLALPVQLIMQGLPVLVVQSIAEADWHVPTGVLLPCG